MSLKRVRKKIDKVDKKIVVLLAKRLALTKKIGEIKEKENLRILDKGREIEVIKKTTDLAAKNGLDKTFVGRLFSEITSHMRKNQMKVKKK